MLREARRNKVVPIVASSSAANHSMTFKCEQLLGILNQQMQKQQQQPESNNKDPGAIKEFLIDDPLHFSVLEQSAKNQQMYLQQQQQPQQQQQHFASNNTGVGTPGQFSLTMEDQKRKVEAGYVSFNDSYTACSSVYGVGGISGPYTGSSSTNANDPSACKSTGAGNGSEMYTATDTRPAKIGRMMTAAAAAVLVASHGAKASTVRTLHLPALTTPTMSTQRASESIK